MPEASPKPQSPVLELHEGKVSEVVATSLSAGLPLLLSDLLAKPRTLPLVLIDGQNNFDPASYGNTSCRRLLWVRCLKSAQAMQCADLLLRDGNLPLILLDLHLACERELRQIPLSAWHRLKNQARQSGATLVALTPQAIVPTPHQRLQVNGRFSLDHLELHQPQLQFLTEEHQQQRISS